MIAAILHEAFCPNGLLRFILLMSYEMTRQEAVSCMTCMPCTLAMHTQRAGRPRVFLNGRSNGITHAA